MCLLIDDVTSLIGEAEKSSTKIVVDDKPIKEKDAFESLMKKILTQGRHLGTIVLAIHYI